MTQEKDLVLIYFEDKPLSFARIEGILPDSKRGWYHVKLLLLQIPPQLVTWILRDHYIHGGEFTMNGKKMRLEKVVGPEIPPPDENKKKQGKQATSAKTSNGAKVISLNDVKKK
jgi:hypothetical protein